jgi:hypothetical protein
MADDRYSRWQGLAIGQLSVAVALISGFSVAGLGAALSLLQQEIFPLAGAWRCVFSAALGLLVTAAFLSCAAVITRLLDFRLTAREVRKKQRPAYDKPLTLFGCNSEDYSRFTWRLFWPSCVSFAVGAALLVACFAAAYADRLH